MSKSNSSNKKKIAIALMSTLFCAGNGNRNNISAMNTIEKNKTQSSQTLAAVGGRLFVIISLVNKDLLRIRN